ncbi:unnamed protein product, partial [Symbiodinium necroappetens]
RARQGSKVAMPARRKPSSVIITLLTMGPRTASYRNGTLNPGNLTTKARVDGVVDHGMRVAIMTVSTALVIWEWDCGIVDVTGMRRGQQARASLPKGHVRPVHLHKTPGLASGSNKSTNHKWVASMLVSRSA